MAALRDTANGCPWDRAQDFKTISPYTIEEAYEVADAIERSDMTALREELGDLLFQVVFHARMAEEQGLFTFAEVAEDIAAKLVRRHPHVFSDAEAGSASEQQAAWDAHKRAERVARGQASGGLLDDILPRLPALTVAAKTGKRAASVGFDWANPDQVIDKIHEELAELAEARRRSDPSNIEEELGDLLLAVTTLARHLDVDADQALRGANRKFAARFGKLERLLADEGSNWSDYSLDELEARWQQIKRQ